MPAGGIAALHPGDVDIERHPDVILVEQFEHATLTELFKRWTDVRNGPAMSLSSDVPHGSPGRRSLNIPWTGGGVSDGGHLYKQLIPGVDDTLYVRYYIKYPTNGTYRHTGVWMGGSHPPLGWPKPEAGVRPVGNDRFIAAAEQNTQTSRFDHYTYWMTMHRSGDGQYWGNFLLNAPNVQARTGQWTCVEHMVKLNNPVTASNGEHAIWLDGVKVSHLGPGFPRGSWSGGIFTQDPAGSPFEGFRWRSTTNLNLNWIWLQNYSPGSPAGFQADLKFDHVVVARSSIGCLRAAAWTEPAATLEPALKRWPNEPTGFAPFDNQPWDLLTRPGARMGGRLVRVLERLQGFLSPQPERRNGWSYLRRASSKYDDIVTDATARSSPPRVLRIVFTPDMKKDHEPSVHWISLPNLQEVYTGWWMKLSPNWTCSPAGCGKITFLFTQNGGQVYTNLHHQAGNEVDGYVPGPPYRITLNTEWTGIYGGQKIWYPNVTTTLIDRGEWHRVEFYYKWETTPGASDGIIRWWVDGTLNGNYTNMRFPTQPGFQEFQYAPTLQNPPPAEQYMYIDHTYVSTR